MKLDYSPRASGKTTRLIEWLRADKDRLMLTFNLNEEHRLRHEYPDVAERIMAWETYKRKHMGAGAKIKEVGIDNADLILQNQVLQPIERLAITDIDDEDEPPQRTEGDYK